jgi:hypothetical protein
MNSIEEFLGVLRQNPTTTWVADEIDETLSQGVSMNVKEAATDSRFFELVPSQDLPANERNKRQKYETSRPFTEEEKVEVIIKAFEVMYLDLPAIRASAISNLKMFGGIQSLTFSSSDEESIEKVIVHEISDDEVSQELEKYRGMHSSFIRELEK